MDKLDELFSLQKKFMIRVEIPPFPVNIETHEGQNVIRQSLFWASHEIHEAIEWLQRKPWRGNPPPTNRVEYEKELVDAFHFFLEGCILSGISAEKLYLLYCDKMKVNIKRQDNHY